MTNLNDATFAGDDPLMPAHIEQTLQAIARLHLEHHRGATPWQRTVDRLTRFFGRPRFAAMLVAFLAAWLALNLALLVTRGRTFDPPPFSALQGLATGVALFMTVFILITQRRSDQLSELREQLTLELALLSEQKAAKMIELLEELRRDMPNVVNRVDGEAEALAKPADPEAELVALKESQLDPADEAPAPEEPA
ncbi:MAG TPA: DUF1003 domain-containing protein [Phenylobacterium sp.]|jgi:uncharacterized membrane protein|uniref:DUF1003 domain-containing protein n=1 Tax=Phenylobacterium sp. TaxID=1871053 RepID=UPI002B96D35D|nr:DUF1003 domain-containing protein [Phenylobacterium sp.]HXA38797.1 DUF1003 domain-containing protein [Phenylobacterium sp.]